MVNLKQFKELILKYESIDENILKEFEADLHEGVIFSEDLLGELTGYGWSITCTLCEEVVRHSYGELDCYKCVYVNKTTSKCYEGVNEPTYDAFEGLESFQAIIQACKNRAEYMRSIINWYE